MNETCLFSDLKGHEDSTLFIIGNGFDLYHGILSSYQNYYHWLKTKGKDAFIEGLEKIFPEKLGNKFLLWSDFEGALGSYDIPSIYKTYAEGIDTIADEQAKEIGKMNVSPIINDIIPSVKQWAKEIDITRTKQLLPLSKEDLYLTFNYTRTLEDVYMIPSSHICHIHGCITDEGHVIVGHNNHYDRNDIDNAGFPGFKEKGMMDIADSINTLWKDPENTIKRHNPFFEKTYKIDRVVVLGHSLSAIDKRYFGEVAKGVVKDCHWHLSKHKPEDEANISDMMSILKHNCSNRWIFNL